MNKLFFILGFLLPLPAYFNDNIAEFIQGLGGDLWILFSNLGVMLYPIYLLIFVLPIFLIISLIWTRFKPEFKANKIFLKLLYGFFISSILFLLFALLAISQFKFTQ